jgi:hypothetical protein
MKATVDFTKMQHHPRFHRIFTAMEKERNLRAKIKGKRVGSFPFGQFLAFLSYLNFAHFVRVTPHLRGIFVNETLS